MKNFSDSNIKSSKSFKYRLILIIISLIFITTNLNSIYLINLKSFFKQLNYWKKNYDNSSIISELNNYKDRYLYLKNKTEFYFQYRKRYLEKHNVNYNESNLTTFQDKLNWLVIHESPQYKSSLVDKIKIHDYSKKILGKDICVPILKIYNDVNEVNFNDLPNKFVLKLNHGSGFNIICENKTELNIPKTLEKLNYYKNKNYGLSSAEFQYIYVKRKIFAEKYLSKNIIDYKIFCFNGEPQFIQVRKCLNETNNIKLHNHYDVNWKLTEIESGIEGYIRDPNIIIKKPKNLKLMLKYARLLSKEFVFVRVDLYEFEDRVYLGELTFTPTNGFVYWKNNEQNLYLFYKTKKLSIIMVIIL